MDGYNSGYGQARADVLIRIKEALATVDEGIADVESWADDPAKVLLALRQKRESLLWIRALVKSIKSKHLGE